MGLYLKFEMLFFFSKSYGEKEKLPFSPKGELFELLDITGEIQTTDQPLNNSDIEPCN